jgi:tetratricopeptide (TPR) repeat protein
MNRPLHFVLLIVLAAASAAIADELPVDEQAIVAEMEGLIDTTPDPDAKTWKRVQELQHKGTAAHDAHRYDDAVRAYREALALAPVTDSVYYELAYTYTSMGDQAMALDAITRALTINPKFEMSYVLKASILDNLGSRDRAIEEYQKLLDIQPESYLGHLNLGITLQRTGRYDEGEAALRRASEIDPDKPSPYFLLAAVSENRGFDYDERRWLQKFLQVGKTDPRREQAEKRLKELTNHEIALDPEHPYPALQLGESMARVNWKTKVHQERFPEARGYVLTAEEDLDVYRLLLSMWREQKKKDPTSSFGSYDLLLAIDDAGFLEEYVWYNRQKILGDRARAWLDEHPERVNAFLAWARAEGRLSDRPEGPVPTALDRYRQLPLELMERLDASKVKYEINVEAIDAPGLVQEARARFGNGLRLRGDDRVDCRNAVRNLGEELPKAGTMALLPMFRCFVPGTDEYETGALRARSLGLEPRVIAFSPVGAIAGGETVRVQAESSWLPYGLAKAAWRYEPGLREENGGPADPGELHLAEELYALGVLVGAYANSLEPDEPKESAEASALPERVPALDRLLDAAKAGLVRGYALYEVVHKTYGIPLDRLTVEDAEVVKKYLFAHVIARTGTK